MKEIITSTYEIIKEIGSGGGGVVYLAEHKRLGVKVVLKIDKRSPSTPVERLRQEVDTLKELRHPFIPQVYDYFVMDSRAVTVMEYIEGESLDRPLKRGVRFQQSDVIRWAIQLLSALDYLHSPTHGEEKKAYVHSDIKPANIMCDSSGNAHLIDFNISKAIDDSIILGRSPGYASPEHYGLDYSTSALSTEGNETELIRNADGISTTATMGKNVSRKTPTPDVRSDIYGVGATLYHFISGRRPDKSAVAVLPLAPDEASPEIRKIISKAMNPNPDFRYQTAAEMREAFLRIRETDIRTKKYRDQVNLARGAVSVLMIAGILSTIAGLGRMQTAEKWQNLTEKAQTMLEEGDSRKALSKIMEVYSGKSLLGVKPAKRSQRVLTDILNVYDVSDSYKIYRSVELPAAPFTLEISPDAKTAACICSGKLVIVDLETAEVQAELLAEASMQAEVEYLNEDILLFAGENALTAYQISEENVLWTGDKATTIAISGDGSKAAAVYEKETSAWIYDTTTGEKLQEISFEGRSHRMAENTSFIKDTSNLFCLNEDGTRLASSFEDGSLSIFKLDEAGAQIKVFDTDSGYEYFDGGFDADLLAFSAASDSMKESVYSVIDTKNVEQIGGVQFEGDEGFCTVHADEKGVLLGIANELIKHDPITDEQKVLVDTTERIHQFSYDGENTMILTDSGVHFFDENASEISSFATEGNLIAIEKNKAILGSTDETQLIILNMETHTENSLLKYDPSIQHVEVRCSQDKNYIMLFGPEQFTIYNRDGEIVAQKDIPDAKMVLDQQYRRDETSSWLEVIYTDGKTDLYDATSGELLKTENREALSEDLYEELETEHFRVESAVHEKPKVYDKASGKLIAELTEDAYLTYITELTDYLIVQYTSTSDTSKGNFGYIMDHQCRILAYLPNLTDVLEDSLIFDYPAGWIRETQIYKLEELLNLAKETLEEDAV